PVGDPRQGKSRRRFPLPWPRHRPMLEGHWEPSPGRLAMKRWLTLLLTIGGVLPLTGAAPAAGDKTQGALVIVDAQGNTHKVKDWKFTEGTSRPSWLPGGVEALEVYEGKLVPLKRSVLAYVPLGSVRSIAF